MSSGQKGSRGALPNSELGHQTSKRGWWPEQGRDRAAPPHWSPCAHISHVAAGTSEEEGLKIITPSCFPH